MKIHDKEEFPADLLLLASSEHLGDCKVQTCNLDGEVNLKTKQALSQTMALFAEDKLISMTEDVCVKVNPPCYGLSTFAGSIKIQETSWLDYRQLLLKVFGIQGSNLKNTHFVLGMVVYVGSQTKIMMNQRSTPFKRSHFELILNKIVIFQLLIQTGLCLFLAISSVSFENSHKYSPFSQDSETSSWVIGSTTYFSFFILLNSLIPISMIVSLELVKFIQTFYLEMDLKMYSEEQDRPAKVQAMSILEELGCIDYILCDKTGTLTANIMEFKGCNIAGVTYIGLSADGNNDHFDTQRNMINSRDENSALHDIIFELGMADQSSKCEEILLYGKVFERQAEFINEFLCALLLCNEVVTDKSSQEGEYLSSSPDEVALIKAAKVMGYEFMDRTHAGVNTKILGTEKFFEVLAVNEFSPERKRMSVIVKHPDDGSIRLYIKGADEAIMGIVDDSLHVPITMESESALKEFAEHGLRTLDVGFKILEDPEPWLLRFKEEKCNFSDRQKENLEKLAEEIEQKVFLLGITAVEDRLQKSVGKAIREFTAAGIKVWMITGDKLETAENIAYSCNLLSRQWKIYEIRSNSVVSKRLEQIIEELRQLESKGLTRDMAVIIEGDALAMALEGQKELFYKITSKCKAVVCCRANPKQKAKVVTFIRKMDTNAKTLAIGDGGNDTSMLQCAHIGVGIYGKEGHQAADCSDFAIGEFRFLRQLLFVHGRWNSRRIGFFILYFFFKNLVFTLVQGYFAFISGFSGQTVWDDWYLLLFNSAITAAGIVCYSLWDQDVNYRLEPVIKRFWPLLYLDNKTNLPLTVKKYLGFMAWGIACSILVFWICTNSFAGITNGSGDVEVMWEMSVCMYSSIVVIVSCVLIMKMKYWTWVQHAVIWGLGFALYCPAFMFIYNLVPGTYVYLYTQDFLGLFVFWASLGLCTGVCCVPYYGFYLYCELFRSTYADLVYQGRYSIVGARAQEVSIAEKIETFHGAVTKTQKNSV